MRDVLPKLKKAIFMGARNGKAACCLDVNKPCPTLRTNCWWTPKRDEVGDKQFKYRARENDVCSIDDAVFLNAQQMGVIGGFDLMYAWPKDRRVWGRLIGNSVAPPAMAAVVRAMSSAGLLWRRGGTWTPENGHKHPQAVETLEEVQARMKSLVGEATPNPEKENDTAKWKVVADEAVAQARVRTKKKRMRTETLWNLSPPRRAQHPATVEFVNECDRRNLPTRGRSGEINAGWGARNATPDIQGKRALLSDAHPAMKEAAERIQTGRSFCKLDRPVTGGPNVCKHEYKRSGAPPHVLKSLDKGYEFEFTRIVPPIGCGGGGSDGNHKGCDDPRFQSWLYGVFAEFLLLGIVSERSTKAYVTCPLNVIPKADYDEHDADLKHRLRVLLDQRPLNDYLNPPKFRNESLDKARGLMNKDDVILTYDIASGFYCAAAHPDSRKYMGCNLGGRTFVWNCTPMGVSTSPYVFSSMMWVLAKKLRRRGFRMIQFVDDFAFFVKPEDADRAADYIEDQFRKHGLLIYKKKSCHYFKNKKNEWQRRLVKKAKVLGIDIDLNKMLFQIPQDKKDKIRKGIKELLDTAFRGEAVHMRKVASAVGRIMATHVAVGDATRRITRDSYAFVAEVTGVPPDATKRQLKVAWDKYDFMPMGSGRGAQVLVRGAGWAQRGGNTPKQSNGVGDVCIRCE